MNNHITELVNELNDEAVVIPGLDFAFLGTASRCGSSDVVAYDYDKVMAFLNGTVPNPVEYFNVHFNSGQENDPVFVCLYDSIEAATEAGFSFLKPDGLEKSFIGVTIGSFERPPVGVFSYEKCVTIRTNEVRDNDPNDEDPEMTAIEDLEFNTFGAYVGEQTPFFLENEVEVEQSENTH